MPKQKNYEEILTLRVSREMALMARQEAKRQHRPLTEILRDLLRAWLADKIPALK